jgi:imidazolonepropionase-like amidohydrolase
LATLEGAKALGLGDRIGTLEEGKDGGLIAVRLTPEFDPKKLAASLIQNTTDRELRPSTSKARRFKL